MNQTHFFVIKVLDKFGNWYTNALVENNFDAIQICKFYKEQLGYSVQVWHKGKDVSYLLDMKMMLMVLPEE